LRYDEVPSAIDGIYPGKDQPLQLGSYVSIEHSSELEAVDGIAIQAWIYPTVLEKEVQAILTKWSERLRVGYGLFLEADGAVSFRINDEIYACCRALRSFEWAFAAASWNAATGSVVVDQRPLANLPDDQAADRLIMTRSREACAAAGVPLVIAGHDAAIGPVGRFNGKIDSPRLYARGLTVAELDALAADVPAKSISDLLAEWDFVRQPDTHLVPDISGHGYDGWAVNCPMRGVTGRNWTGEETSFHRAPAQFNAALFHEDDLEDAGWEPAFTFVPSLSHRSGVYAIRATTDVAEDWIPFFIRPPSGPPPRRLRFWCLR
jgi:N,N-dimethylformamidase